MSYRERLLLTSHYASQSESAGLLRLEWVREGLLADTRQGTSSQGDMA
jgi:hypothetical protein